MPETLYDILSFCDKLVGLSAFDNDEIARQFEATVCTSPPIVVPLHGFSEGQLFFDYGLEQSEVKRTQVQLVKLAQEALLENTSALALFAGIVVIPRTATETLATFGGELEIWATTARAIDTDEVWVATCWGREVAWLTKAIKSEVVPTDKIDKDAHKTDVVKISVSFGGRCDARAQRDADTTMLALLGPGKDKRCLQQPARRRIHSRLRQPCARCKRPTGFFLHQGKHSRTHARYPLHCSGPLALRR